MNCSIERAPIALSFDDMVAKLSAWNSLWPERRNNELSSRLLNRFLKEKSLKAAGHGDSAVVNRHKQYDPGQQSNVMVE